MQTACKHENSDSATTKLAKHMVSKEFAVYVGAKKPPKMHDCSYQEPFIMHGKGAKLTLHDVYLSALLQRHENLISVLEDNCIISLKLSF